MAKEELVLTFREEFKVLEATLNTRYKKIEVIGKVDDLVLSIEGAFERDCEILILYQSK